MWCCSPSASSQQRQRVQPWISLILFLRWSNSTLTSTVRSAAWTAHLPTWTARVLWYDALATFSIRIRSLTCAQTQSSSSYFSPPSNESSFYDPPVTNEYTGQVDLTEVLNFVTDSTQLLAGNTFQRINHNATTVQPVTVQAHIDDTYLPGCRQPTSPAESQCGPQRRQAPRKNGFACNVEGCNKAFDRNCELK